MKNKTAATKKVANSTQKYLSIASVQDDVVILNDGSVRAVLLVSSVNFDLKSEEEQRAMISGYVSFLNTLDYPLQVVIQSRPLNIDDYLDQLKKQEKEQVNELLRMQIADYRQFITELLTLEKIMSKKFFVIVPYSESGNTKKNFAARLASVFATAKVIKLSRKHFAEAATELDKKTNFIMSGLASLGLNSQRLSTQALIELYYNSYNPDLFQKQPLEDINKLRVETDV
ncbi:TraC family protein [Patescibacteria group bacterium]|nr:TraC family protein [Patescibacteria group bacterium]